MPPQILSDLIILLNSIKCTLESEAGDDKKFQILFLDTMQLYEQNL
jgi:hypothetical protein